MNQKEIFLKTESWLNDGLDVAIAFVVETWGSSPRPVGSAMVINNNHEIVGSVSGGCIESFVFGKALEIIKNNSFELLEFGVTDKQAWNVGLTCGGKIKVFLEKFSPNQISEIKTINNSMKMNENIVIATNLENKKKIINTSCEKKVSFSDYFNQVRQSKKSSLIQIENSPWFFKFYGNINKLIIVGAVHIAEPLISMAQILDFEIILIDPRSNYDEKKFNIATKILREWPDEALQRINLDSSCALVTLTHDPKLDDPALEYILKKNILYIGSLGSKKTHEKRKERLRKKGFTEKEISLIHGPIGLDINANTPAEIASSILSEIIFKKNTE